LNPHVPSLVSHLSLFASSWGTLAFGDVQKEHGFGKLFPIESFFGQASEALRADVPTKHSFHLTAVSLSPQDVNIEDLYKGGEQTTRFTFFQRSLGSAFRLEAAACPGWFLCGPAEPQQPVQLTKESEPSTHTEFYFEMSR
jgi:hypothetical protein